MGNETNKFGLSRKIPEETKRAIRTACGFGCVCCGLAIVQYEHIDPEFHEAKEHDVERMALLCANCHDRVTRGFWSKHKIREARKSPWSIRTGRCHDAFDLSSPSPEVWIGTLRLATLPSVIVVNGKRLLSIEPPEVAGGPFQLDCDFYDEIGHRTLQIVRNEWIGETRNWDVLVKGRTIAIRSALSRIVLQLTSTPPVGIVVQKLEMVLGIVRIRVRDNVFEVNAGAVFKVANCEFSSDSKQGVVLTIDEGLIRLGHSDETVMRSLTTKPPTVPATSFKIEKNSPCPCGSGLKFKLCCGTLTQ